MRYLYIIGGEKATNIKELLLKLFTNGWGDITQATYTNKKCN